VPRAADGEEAPKVPDGMRIVEVADIADALATLHQMINR
jgi:hypothetical protein